ncbi:hypothetical protein TNCV_4295681 [Trichonephila clavipes]|nr:hypothetical protein TNCV_4295681 [Trichonephila clavipes]
MRFNFTFLHVISNHIFFIHSVLLRSWVNISLVEDASLDLGIGGRGSQLVAAIEEVDGRSWVADDDLETSGVDVDIFSLGLDESGSKEELLLVSMSDILCSSQYASTHHRAQKGEEALRSSDMHQARNLPQRWHWGIVLQIRDIIRQFTHGNTKCNTNPNAPVFGIPSEPN